MAEGGCPKVKDLVVVLKAVDWHSLGLQLDLDSTDLSDIDDQHTKIERKRSAMFDLWLDKEAYPTWDMIVTALERMGRHNKTIRTIKSTYITNSAPANPPQVADKGAPPRAPDYTKPTMRLLQKFEELKILERVGAEYNKFGVQLLRDDNGDLVRTIEKKCLRDPTDIKDEISRDWLAGKGEPVTWNTLVQVLVDIDKISCARELVLKLRKKGVEVDAREIETYGRDVGF